MRTTLKRGMGRGATLNGDVRPILPPGTRSAITRYRQPEPRRRGALSLVARGLLWLLAAAGTVAVGLAGGAYLYLDRSVAEVVARTPDVVRAAEKLDTPLPDQPATALVIGYDRRPTERDVEARSDTVMLIRADPVAEAVSLLSFPRDLVVDIKCPGRAPRQARINEAYTDCGAEGTLQTVRALTGVPVNYLVTVNFRGFKQVVAKLGGVWVDVDRRYFNDNSSGGPTYPEIDLEPGYQKLNGQRSLDFVRYRHFDSDLYRLARQQLFVRSFTEQLRSAFSPSNVARIVNVLTNNVEVAAADGRFKKRLVVSYGLLGFKLPQGHVFQSRIDIDCLRGQFELTADPACIERAVQEFSNPDVEAPGRAASVASGRKPKRPRGLAPRQISVSVLNGNGVAGSAANASYHLRRLGYPIVLPPGQKPGNAPSWNYERTKVFWDARYPRAPEAAKKVARLFGSADAVRVPRSLRALGNGAMLVVVVGQSFHGSLAAEPVDSTPKRQPPEIRRDPGVTLESLRAIRRKVPFRLQLPTVLERSSSLDRERPVRVYDLAGHRAVRVTYLSGKEPSAYWGVQMTNWLDPPITRDPNYVLRSGGRRYELHLSGSRVHMVVFREGGATYWVDNTLLNSLSNETMIAIAKGLEPLKGG